MGDGVSRYRGHFSGVIYGENGTLNLYADSWHGGVFWAGEIWRMETMKLWEYAIVRDLPSRISDSFQVARHEYIRCIKLDSAFCGYSGI